MWRPEFVLLEGEECSPIRYRKLSNKQIADVVEALIGAALYGSGFDAGLKAAVALGVETYGMTSWDVARSLYHQPKFLSRKRYIPAEEPVLEAFEYRFHNPNYLVQALQHGSCPIDETDPIPSYDRLELMGDAVLEIEVAMWLYDRFPDYGPDRLTKMKSHLVRNKSLGAICDASNLQKHIRHFNGGVPAAMVAYSQQLQYLKTCSSKRDYYLDCEPPKFMSDIIESIIGAIFLDSGMQTEPVRHIFHKCFLSRLDPEIDYSEEVPVMSILTHLLQKFGCEMAHIKRHDDVKMPEINERIVKKAVGPERTVTLKLYIHDHLLCAVAAPSYSLAKLKLAEDALTALKVGSSAEWIGTQEDENFKILKQLCDCAPKVKEAEVQVEDDQFRF